MTTKIRVRLGSMLVVVVVLVLLFLVFSSSSKYYHPSTIKLQPQHPIPASKKFKYSWSESDIMSSLIPHHSPSAPRWKTSWIPGTPMGGEERSRLQAAYTSLFVKVVTRIGLDLSPSDGSECPFTRGMDEWTPLKYLGRAESIFQHGHLKPHSVPVDETTQFGTCAVDISVEHATAPPTQAEISGSERTTRLYSLFREEIIFTLHMSPMTYFSDACGLSLPVPILSTCLTAAALAATSSEFLHLNKPTFSIFSSIERFRSTVCAHSLPCILWRTGHWEAQPAQNTTAPNVGSGKKNRNNAAATFASIAAATVGPSNPKSIKDIRRIREHRNSLFPWKSITLTHPRFRALQVGEDKIEFSASRGLFTAQSGVDGSIKPLDLPPNEFFQRILKVSRSVEVVSGEDVSQRFPSLITFDGDSLYRGLFYSSVQRLREHGLGSTTTYPLDANLYDVIPPVASSGTHGETLYFMYPSPTGVVDVLVERRGMSENGGENAPPTEDAAATFRNQRRKCAEELGVLARKDPVGTQQLVLKFLSSSMVNIPTSGTEQTVGESTTSTSYALPAFLGTESAVDVILYAHIICGFTKGIAFSPSFRCPLVILHFTFNNLQQKAKLDTWSPHELEARKLMFQSLTSKEHQRAAQLNKAATLVTRVGMRVHGIGAWPNNYEDSIINAAALSSAADFSDPPIIINRLATSHSRCCHRESCALIHMREGGQCYTSTTASHGSDIRGICGLISPVHSGSSRKSWDGIPDDYLRYEHLFLKDLDDSDFRFQQEQVKQNKMKKKYLMRKNSNSLRGETVEFDLLREFNLRYEAYVRALTVIWESSLSPNNTIFSDWCQSVNEGPQDKLFKLSTLHHATPQLWALCRTPQQYVDAVKSATKRSNTVFYDALLLRSLLPFGSTDILHYDCCMRVIPRDRNTIAPHQSHLLKSLPGLFSFPNNSLHSLKSTSQSMCITPTIDAAGLAGLLYSTFPDHFSLMANMSVHSIQDSIRSCSEGSMDVGFPLTSTDDHCRSTFQRSELSLLFGL